MGGRFALGGAVVVTVLGAGVIAWLVLGVDERRGAGARPGSDRVEATDDARTEAIVRAELAAVASPETRSVPGRMPARVAAGAPRVPARAPFTVRRAYELLGARDRRERFEGLQRLARLRPAEAVPLILAYLDDTRDEAGSSVSRLAAVALLGGLEGVSTADELVALFEGGDVSLRHAAACALARQGDPALVERETAVLEAELASPDAVVRARAVAGSSALGSGARVPHFVRLLADPDRAVRVQAIDALVRADERAVLPELERLLADPSGAVRARAKRAIRTLRGEEEGAGGR